MSYIDADLINAIKRNVSEAIAEDVGEGDRTAELIPADVAATATVVCREHCVIAGRPWFDEVFEQCDPAVTIDWSVADGQQVEAGTTLCNISGPARPLLTGERCALNFLQLFSATATVTRRCVDAVSGTSATILDTRKTIPGLRLGQKYAVRCGGGKNHRVGLYDAILIKENHISSSAGIDDILRRAQHSNDKLPIEIEVESVDELRTALSAGATRVMLDNFNLPETLEAVRINRDEFGSAARLEASGGKTLEDLRATAETGVDYISVGALTKNVAAIDFSMRIVIG